MPVVVGAGVIVLVALAALLLAYVFAVAFAPLVEGLLRQIPFVGGVLARKVDAALTWAFGKFFAYVKTGVAKVGAFFNAIGDVLVDLPAALNAYLVELPARLDHLAHVTVHEIVKAFVNPVRELAQDAAREAAAAAAAVAAVAELPLAHFRGIEHGVESQLDRLRDVIENVDLPLLETALSTDLAALGNAVVGDFADLRHYTDQEFGRLWDQLHKIPLAQIIEGLAAATAAAALAQVITREAGLDSPGCRRSVRMICLADPDAWGALLEIAGFSLAWMGLREFVQLAQDFAHETVPPILEHVGGG